MCVEQWLKDIGRGTEAPGENSVKLLLNPPHNPIRNALNSNPVLGGHRRPLTASAVGRLLNVLHNRNLLYDITFL